jgi:hypothetical protein
MLERTAIKLMPVVQEIINRMVPEKKIGNNDGGGMRVSNHFNDSSINDDQLSIESNYIPELQNFDLNKLKNFNYDKGAFDMRNVLGFLNQNEWLWALNIGNIMQISPLTIHELHSTSSCETELTRELVLEKVSFLAVSYFCISTELRFLSQSKEPVDFDPAMKRKES